MKILLLGMPGILARAVVRELSAEHEIIARSRKDYDIRDPGPFRADLDRLRPGAVVNAAAFTRVDEAEDCPDLVMEVNGRAPGRMARDCCERGVRFVHLSTDYVFDGTKPGPYSEDDPPRPVNVYGQSKLVSEVEVVSAHPHGHLILRTSWLFGVGGRNFPKSILARYRSGERRFQVVADQRGRPTYARDLARALGACLAKDAKGIYHACNAGEATWYELAREVFAAAGVEDEVRLEPVSSSEFRTRARRPANSVLDTGKLEREIGFISPPHRRALERYLDEEGLIQARPGKDG